MAENPPHIPVMLNEVLDFLSPRPGGRYLDGTLGYGGHAEAILSSAPSSELLGIDRDKKALSLATARLASFRNRLHPVHGHYADFPSFLSELEWGSLDGALIDIGVSSMQIDTAERGFSFLEDAPLDMRMDQSEAVPTARDIINNAEGSCLRDIIARYGEEPMAAQIVRGILRARAEAPIETTGELARLVERSYSKSWRDKARHHPATRTFQALRIAVNDELGQLEAFLAAIPEYLKSGGRLVVLTFHSLEDRMVKQAMQGWAKGCVCPAYQLQCTCGHTPRVKLLTKHPLRAGKGELTANPRASSAKLRAVEKC
ncbi:MAG: 16S rRNA (cytosine(1402)-N(4))-methyltransferase RsmH [Desulfovibrio sp.]|nr:16S rRNA (cytosine(1402)-N(4))-methyltransferase RsmH [Desulfovibrio sp.]